MVATQFLVAGLIAAASASSLVVREDAYFAALLKRQEPGTPAYDCHENCGTAITLSRGSDPCNNAAFVEDYNNCLQCAGPSGFNIWRYYGGTLSTAGAKCGLPTEPSSGGSASTPAASSAAAQTSAAAQSSTAAASSAPALSSAAPTTSQAAATTEAATSAPSPSANASATFTSSAPVEVTTNGAAGLRVADAAGVVGAIFVGALIGM